MIKTLKERFEEKYKVDKSGCWIWTASTCKGYGQFWHQNKQKKAHRMAFEIYRGPVAKEFCVCHICDNPLCVNPDHLFLGTNPENTKDRDSKGRQSKGEHHYCRKLTIDQVIAIRSDKRSIPEISQDYGVSRAAIYKVVNKISWKDIK